MNQERKSDVKVISQSLNLLNQLKERRETLKLVRKKSQSTKLLMIRLSLPLMRRAILFSLTMTLRIPLLFTSRLKLRRTQLTK